MQRIAQRNTRSRILFRTLSYSGTENPAKDKDTGAQLFKGEGDGNAST